MATVAPTWRTCVMVNMSELMPRSECIALMISSNARTFSRLATDMWYLHGGWGLAARHGRCVSATQDGTAARRW